MIPKDTIEEIFNSSRIEEVVSDYVNLKKKGANYMGLCPFHDDRSPSMSVSPVKGIYKCFSCGASGNSVNFVMEHEQITYPEALKLLAKKYNIEIVEQEVSKEQQEKQNAKESMFLVTEFAAKAFHNDMLNTDEGKSVGLSYIKSREINQEMIEKFNLGYALSTRDHFTQKALVAGYEKKFLESTGLSIVKNSAFDRFSGRVIFPIQNLSGRIVGFGGRTLSSEKKIAKYLNSPESEIYHKGKVLYGLFQAKRSVAKNDNCFLVEGYTDVISLHQKGIENVVSSSGTALTKEQIQLIKRFTPNITLALDGDEAGQKAAIRGVDLILTEGLNVKVVSFPPGEDPDSFARKNPSEVVKEHLNNEAVDFITFKCNLLLKESGNDPIKRAGLIKDVVGSIALIPDPITRNVFMQSASKILDIDEKIILADLNKQRNKALQNEINPSIDVPDLPPEFFNNSFPSAPPEGYENQGGQVAPSPEVEPENSMAIFNESNLLRVLLQFGFMPLYFENEEKEKVKISVIEFIINELQKDDLAFTTPIYQEIYAEILSVFETDEVPTEKYFLQSSRQDFVKKVIEICSEKYVLSERWKDHQIFVPTEIDQLKKSVQIIVNRFKLDNVLFNIKSIQKDLEKEDCDEDELLTRLNELIKVKKALSKQLGRFF